MKRLFVLLFAIMLFLCACSPQDFTLDHKIIDVQYSSDMEYPEVLVFRDYDTFNSYARSITDAVNALPEQLHTDNKNLVEPLMHYTSNYFKNNILIILYIKADSGGNRYEIGEITKTASDLTVKIRKTRQGQTCDMNAWCFLLELDKSYDTELENIRVISENY